MNGQFALLDPREQEPIPDEAYGRWLTEDGDTTVQFFRTGQGYLVRFCGMADFAITEANWSVACTPAPECELAGFEDLYLNQVAPLILSHQGATILHASAAAGPLGSLAFVGATGRGKSTLAAGCAKAGFGFMSDDGLLIERKGSGWLARPNRPVFRLRADSIAAVTESSPDGDDDEFDAKQRLAASPLLPFHDSPQALCRIYFLGNQETDSVCFTPLRPAEALTQLLEHSFILDAEDKMRMGTHFSILAELAELPICFSLDYPRRYDVLPTVVETIMAHSSESGARSP